MESTNANEILTAEEAAGLLKMPVSGIWRRVRLGELPAIRLGRYYRFSRTALLDWLNRQCVAKASK